MKIKKLIRSNLVEKLPSKYCFFILRLYLYHFVKNYIKDDVKIIKQLCNPSKKSLDIGANKGVFTLFLCKYSSHVYCFEPLQYLGNYLKERFKDCNVTVECCALGNTNEKRYLRIPSIENTLLDTRSSLVAHFNSNDYLLGRKITNIEKVIVNVKRLDDFQIDKIGFMKIDVEGFEMQVLEGGIKTIKRNMPNMLIEIEQRHHKEKDINDIFKFIKDIGYYGYFFKNKKITTINEFNKKEMQNNCNEKSSNYVNNFIFLPSPISNLRI